MPNHLLPSLTHVSALRGFDRPGNAIASVADAVYGSNPRVDGYVHCGHVPGDHAIILYRQIIIKNTNIG
jgi:hypothetical protein